MAEVSVLICIAGVYFLAKSLVRKDSFRGIFTSGTVFFLVSALGMFLMLRGSQFIHDDNFSHWATATRVLLENDRFPNFTDSNIAYQSYPLGSASFIYYICFITGSDSEWVQMFAQAILMIASLTCLFAFSKRWYQAALLWLGSLILLAGNTNFVDLLVDTLLPLVALGGFALVYDNRDRLNRIIWWTVPVLVFLVTIKNSGIFFSLAIWVYMLTGIREKSEFKPILAVLLITLSTLLLWQRHVDQVFSDGLMSSHSMSLGYFEKMLGLKESEDIGQILSGFHSKIFSVNNGAWIVFLLFLLIPLAAYVLREEPVRNHRGLFCTAVFSYLAYQLTLLGMYLFTMPLNEALRLAGFERYHDSILIFITGILLIGIVQQLPVRCTFRKTGLITLVLASAYLLGVFYAITPYPAYYKRQDIYENVRGCYRMDIAEMKAQTEMLPGKRYLLLVDSQTKVTGFLRQLAKYEFRPSAVSVQYVNKIENPDQLKKDFDYIIGIDNTEEVNSFMTNVMNSPFPVCVITGTDE